MDVIPANAGIPMMTLNPCRQAGPIKAFGDDNQEQKFFGRVLFVATLNQLIIALEAAKSLSGRETGCILDDGRAMHLTFLFERNSS
jgi:hypothetical protein